MSKETDKQSQFQSLSNAVFNNDADTIRAILNKDRSVLDLDTSGFTRLMDAAYTGKLQALQALMEYNPDTTTQDCTRGAKGENVLHYAGRGGQAKSIAAILKKDKRALNQVDDRGWSPIMEATLQNEREAVQEFLKYEPDLDIKTKSSGGTVFTIAETRGDTHAPILAMLHAAKARQEEKKSGNDVIAQVASLEEGKDQKPSSDLPLPPPASAPNIESKEVSASQPPVPPQTQIAQVSSDTTMQPAQKSTERA